jgi:hypothetical protein
MKRRGAACLLAYGLFLAIAFPRHVNSQEKGKVTPRPKADINNLMKELLNTKIEQNQTDIALWMPWEAFVEIRTQPDGHDREAIGREFEMLKSYMIIIVLSYVDRDEGSRIYANKLDFKETATLRLSTGAEFPLAVGVPPDVLAIGQAFQQFGAINRGENGKNTQVLLFSSTSRDGKNVLDPRRRNALILDYKLGFCKVNQAPIEQSHDRMAGPSLSPA